MKTSNLEFQFHLLLLVNYLSLYINIDIQMNQFVALLAHPFIPDDAGRDNLLRINMVNCPKIHCSWA
jgi:hypothetical protein